MHIRIANNKWMYLDNITPDIEEIMVRSFSVRHPKSRYIDTRSGWDGVYRRYNKNKQMLALPFLGMLKEVCSEYNIPYDINDERGSPKYPSPNSDHISENFIDGIELFPWQIRGLKAACNEDIGIFHLPTGSGKSEIACGLIKMFHCPTVVIVEQIVILEQIIKRIELRNVIYDDIGQFCHGHKPDGNMVLVGSIQSLNVPSEPEWKLLTKSKMLKRAKEYAEKGELPDCLPQKLRDVLQAKPNGVSKLSGHLLTTIEKYVADRAYDELMNWYKVRKKNAQEIQEYVSKCDMLIIDECDRSSSYDQLFKIFNGRRRYGLSGTPYDPAKPVENFFLTEHLGSVICEADRKEVLKAKQIIPVKYIMVGFAEDGDKNDRTVLDIAERETLIDNVKFHGTVKRIVDAFPNDRTLIIVDTLNIKDLGKALEAYIPGSKFVYGETSKAQRRAALKDFESGNLKVLIGSKILKRGTDINGGMDNLILCGGGKLYSNLNQIIGRAVRKNEKGFARIFDFLFLNNAHLYGHSRNRLKAATSICPTTVVVNGKKLDGQVFIKSRFRIPK